MKQSVLRFVLCSPDLNRPEVPYPETWEAGKRKMRRLLRIKNSLCSQQLVTNLTGLEMQNVLGRVLRKVVT